MASCGAESLLIHCLGVTFWRCLILYSFSDYFPRRANSDWILIPSGIAGYFRALKPQTLAYIFMVSLRGWAQPGDFMVEDGFSPGIFLGSLSPLADFHMVQGGLVRRMSAKISDKTFTTTGRFVTAGMTLLASIAVYPASWLALWGDCGLFSSLHLCLSGNNILGFQTGTGRPTGGCDGRIRSLGAGSHRRPLSCAGMYFAFGRQSHSSFCNSLVFRQC